MKLKISFFNPGIFKQDLRQHGWIGVIYLLCLLFVLPLQMLLIISNEENYPYYIKELTNYFQVAAGGQLMFLFTLPVIAGIFLFRYLQTEASVDMTHSFPVKRNVHYFSHIISGVFMLVLPIVITAAFAFIITKWDAGFNKIFTFPELLSWIGIASLLTVFLFLLTVLVGMITGISVVQGILTYVFLFLPIGILSLLNLNLGQMLFGFSSSYYLYENLEVLSPFMRFMEIASKPFSSVELIIYCILTIIFLIAGKIIYDRRHLERAGDAIVFPYLKPVFKYGMTFCTMLLSGAYFSTIQDGSTGWLIFGYISGSIIGYIIAEIILQKSWRILKPSMAISFGSYSIIIVLIYFSLSTDVFGYEKKLPSLDNIEAVYLENGDYLNDGYYGQEVRFSSDQTYIQDVREFHEAIIQQKSQIIERDNTIYHPPTLLVYKLKNGGKVAREYVFPNKLFAIELKPVIGSIEYKKTHFPLNNAAKKANVAEISSNAPINKNLKLTDQKEIAELKTAIEKDYLAQSYEDITSPGTPWGSLEFSHRNPSVYGEESYYTHLQLKPSYKETEKWLADKNYLTRVKLLPEDIVTLEVIKGNNDFSQQEIDIEAYYRELTNKKVEVTDKKLINEVLNKFSDYDEEANYYVKMRFVNGNEWYVVLREKNVPAELLQALK
ncbi:hypothetical protein [Metabacillus fastidiosus]|uniref:hypothetical protein n=1 Tax=Metabacillus fastidiosus TaxID=1458 RepID=UPI000826CA2F|nr:hypothetical protein [Metabacillus fastidiosus]MED4460956.1 hypothetical protein [Metabacillus fastidiosus]